MVAKHSHPDFDAMQNVWRLCRDSYDGPKAIKARGPEYLPMTSGQIARGAGKLVENGDNIGQSSYNSYVKRAVYPSIFFDATEKVVSTLSRERAVFELPGAMAALELRATVDDESLHDVLRSVFVDQVVAGRLGVLADIDEATNSVVLHQYQATTIRNWDRDFVVLDESGEVMDRATGKWEMRSQFRVLTINDAGYYATAVLDESTTLDEAEFIEPSMRGQRLDAIPFAFINAVHNKPAVSKPPQLGLAEDCLTIYRTEADYRLTLFMQGQATMVRTGLSLEEINSDEVLPVGAEAVMDIAAANATVQFVAPPGTAIGEQRQALENDYNRAYTKAGQLVNTGKARESADAIRQRGAQDTVTMSTLAIAACAGLQRVCRAIAPWYGQSPDAVSVIPNLDFTAEIPDAKELTDLQTARATGFPLSAKSLHAVAVERGYTQLSFEEEMALIEQEEQRMLDMTAPALGGAAVELLDNDEDDEGQD